MPGGSLLSAAADVPLGSVDRDSRIQGGFVGLRLAGANATADGEEFVERRENLLLLLGLSRGGF